MTLCVYREDLYESGRHKDLASDFRGIDFVNWHLFR